jgi:hypothetical protein
LLKDILTQPLGAARAVGAPGPLYLLSGGRAWCGRKICAPDGCDLSLDSQPMPNWLAVRLRNDCSPGAATTANFHFFVCNSFAHVARTKRLTFACRPPFVRSVDRESFWFETFDRKPRYGGLQARKETISPRKKSKVFFTPYPPAVLRRASRNAGQYRRARAADGD